MKSLLDHLQCTACGRRYSADDLHTVCPDCGKVLFARYDLDAAKGLTPRVLDGRPWTMWRYGELMPVRREENIVTLGEGMTPLLRASRLGRIYAFEHLFIKEEGLEPYRQFQGAGDVGGTVACAGVGGDQCCGAVCRQRGRRAGGVWCRRGN